MKLHLRIAFIAASVAALSASTVASADEVVVLSGGGAHRTVVLVIEGPNGAEIALEDAAKGLDVSFSRSGRDSTVTLKSLGREVMLENGKSLFSVGGQLRAMASPVRVVGPRTYMAPSSAATVLGAALGQTVTYQPAFRVLIIGAYEAPRLRIANVVSASRIESAIELSRPVPYELRKEQDRVVVTFQADLMEAEFTSEGLPGRIVSSVRFERATPPRIVFELGNRFGAVRTSDRDPQQLVLDFDAALPEGPTASGEDGPGASPSVRPRSLATQAAGSRRPLILVIDPGHGGEDVGAKGPRGRFEKDVTLALARRLRAAVVDALAIQVYLTRDTDVDVPLDERAAIANNFNADIFISLHANGSRVPTAKGTEVFFLSYTAADDEARRIAAQEGPIAAKSGGGNSDVGLILWDMAQAAQLQASSRLATDLHTEIARSALSESRGVKQAPFRVLVGATMPAALVEVGFITNPEEERRLFSESHQIRITDALVTGLGRFVAALRATP